MAKSRSLYKFIRDHRQEIDEVIKNNAPNARLFNDEERRQWVLNDEGLYNWARSEGINI